MVEWDGLENRCAGNCTEGSNPSLSANLILKAMLTKFKVVLNFFLFSSDSEIFIVKQP